MERAAQHPRLLEELGAPLRPGPWYNASVKVHPGGHLATVVLPLQGSLRSSDVTVRVARRGGLAVTELYNIIGPAAWEPLVMDALLGRSGLPGSSVSLLEAVPPAAGSRQQPAAPPPPHPSRRSPLPPSPPQRPPQGE